MRYRILDENGDMQFGNQQQDFYKDSIDLVAQSVLTRLKLWVGEWYLNTSEGTPYQQAALGKNKTSTIQPAIRNRILQTPGVTGIISFDYTFQENPRHATFKVSITTQYGQTDLTGIL